ncbi:signal peptidase I [Streptomyces sp. NPDC005408]|uniref:signal peptidase I n=1 Tax=Streptomyces sp. NPDC005408 TaxID=3155341 RepID=UPI0033B2F24A
MSDSMVPTATRGDRLLFEKAGRGELKRGDIVLFSAPDRYQGGSTISRVGGHGGDRVACCTDDRVTVDDKPLPEPYVSGGDARAGFGSYSVTVPRGRLFLLGDNRGNSRDSRFFLDQDSGTIAESQVAARLTKDWTGAVVLFAGVVLGRVLALIGAGCGLAGWLVGRKLSRPVAPPTPPFSSYA